MEKREEMSTVCFGSANVEVPYDAVLLTCDDGNFADLLRTIPPNKSDILGLENVPDEEKGCRRYRLIVIIDGGRGLPVKFCAPLPFDPRPAGSPLNIAVGLRRQDVPVLLVSPLPETRGDYFADGIRGYAQRHDIAMLETPRPITPVTLIIGGGVDGESRTLCHKPAYGISRSERRRIVGAVSCAEATHIFATGIRRSELALTAELFSMARRHPAKPLTCFMPNPRILTPRDRGLRHDVLNVCKTTDVLQVNLPELAIFLGKPEKQLTFPDDARLLAQKTHVRTVIVTRREQGVCAIADGAYYTVQAYPCPYVKDPTGAGDAVLMGFAVARALGYNIEESLCAAVFAAAGNVMAVGGHAGMPTKEAFEGYLVTLRS